MIKRRQIHPQVQKALYRKIDALNRVKLTDDRIAGGTNFNQPFFVGNSLEPQDNSNPVEQQIYRSCKSKCRSYR